jgi:hypothetical protein
MKRIAILSLVVASLSTIVGCGGGNAKSAADCARDEASWTAPEEVAMSFKGSAPSGDKKEKAKVVSIQPNRGGDRPTRGAIHAAY